MTAYRELAPPGAGGDEMNNETLLNVRGLPVRQLYDLDLWIRSALRDGSPEQAMRIMEEALAQNAVEMGFIQHADGSWRWAGQLIWGNEVRCVEQVPGP